ncbi:MAG: PP0621 family protein [Burkholderiaceae bacterium]|nr:PP0621 family protein [Burkholderiaceae bacterium]
MGKLLFWLALVALAFLAMKLVAISQRKREAAQREDAATGAQATTTRTGEGARRAGELAGEMMVQCEHCGVFLPASDAFVDGGHSYCDRAHRDAHRTRQPRR